MYKDRSLGKWKKKENQFVIPQNKSKTVSPPTVSGRNLKKSEEIRWRAMSKTLTNVKSEFIVSS